jgi:hypothetical protein
MIHSVIRFERPGLDDDPSTIEQSVNGFAGLKCASWLKQSIASLDGARVRGEPVPEDWGWALVVDMGKDAYVVGCGIDPDNESGWQVLLGDNVMRGFLPATRRRRTEALQTLTQRVESFLRAQADVSKLTVE